MVRPHIAVIIARLGPYHVARMNALASRIGGDRCIAIEVASQIATYPWSDVEGAAFRRITLFEGRNYGEVGTRELQRVVTRTLQSLAPECVAINGWGFPEARIAARWCAKSSVPSVLMSDSQRRDSLRLWPKEQVKRSIVRQFGAALVAGTPHADYVASLGMDRDRIVIGYDVVDNEHFWRGAERARAGDTRALRATLQLPQEFFLCCSRFVWEKGLSTLLTAYSEYRRSCSRPWDLVAVGDGPLRDRLERERKKLGLDGCVHFPGFKQYEDLPAYYGLARALVLPSLRDTWGLVVNEAMAAGLPVVVSDACGSSTDLVRHGENGLVVPARNAGALAGALSKISAPTVQLRDMGRKSREIIAEWSPERFARSMQHAAEIATERRFRYRSRPRRPRIAVLTNIVPPYRIPVFSHIGARLGEDFQVLALSRREKNRDWSEQLAQGFLLRVLPGWHSYLLARDWALHINWGVRAALRRHRANVVIVGGWDSPASWAALFAAKQLGIRVVLWSGSHAFSARSQGGVVSFLKKAFVRRSDAFFAYGSLAADYLISLGASPDRIVIGTNAIDTAAFAPSNEGRQLYRAMCGVEEKVVILYSGQLIRRKGLDILIRSLSRTPATAELWVVGSGPLRAEYEALANAMIPGRARFLGSKSYDEMHEIYSAADIFVLPSKVEVWGLVLNEAMAAGLPVIASRNAGATRDLVREDFTGLTFDAERLDTLIEALNRLILDPRLRRRLGSEARTLIAQYDTSRYAEDMLRAAQLALEPREAQ